MDNYLTHSDQYKMLREEIMQSIREMGRIEAAGAVAASGIYTWLLTHKTAITTHAVWLIVPWILIYCGIKILDLNLRIKRIADYLQRIEEASFENPNLPGWERYKTQTHHRQYDTAVALIATIFWIFSIGVAIFVAFWQW